MQEILFQDSISQFDGDFEQICNKLNRLKKQYKKAGYINIKFEIIWRENRSYSMVRITGEKRVSIISKILTKFLTKS